MKNPSTLAILMFIFGMFIGTSQTNDNIDKRYYVVESINNGYNTSKSSKIVTESTKDQKIRKNKGDLKSITGRRNALVVYEVYDVKSFTKYMGQSNEVANISTQFYNPEPIYDYSKQ